jgi:uncharacterized protein YndB with AHSA1/START domain
VRGTLQSSGGRWVLRFERRLAHPVEKVWRAVTEPAQLAHWFPAEMRMDLHPGAKIRFVFSGGEGPTLDGEILELDAPRVFAFTWGDSVLRLELLPDEGGCLLRFTHTFDDHPAAASFAAGWETCLAGLASLLVGDLGQQPPKPWPDLHEEYVERFGLGEGTARPSADGFQVRFERQLIRPVDKVWATLTEAHGAAVGGPPPPRFANGYVPAGAVTAVEPPTMLEYQWELQGRPAGRVSWRLSEGNGGARLVLTQTVPAAESGRLPTALAAWHTHIELLAWELRGRTICPWPQDRTEELRKHYAELLG